MKPLKLLIVEDSKDDAALLLRHLSNEGYEVQATIAQTPAEMESALAEVKWDVVVSDYSMPHFSALDALAIVKESNLDIPFIIVSGVIGEDVAVEAMRVGIHDYLMKDNLTRLAPAIEREIQNAASRRTRRQTEKALRRSEANLVNAQRIAHIGSWERDLVNNQLVWSDEVYRIFGVSKEDFGATLESFVNFIHPEDRQSVQATTDAALSQNAPYNIEYRIIRPDGEERVVCEIGGMTFDESGNPIWFTSTVQDITERNAAETEMRLMKSAVDSIAEGIIVSDARKPDNPTIYSNAAFERLTGYSFEEIEGRNCRILQGAETNRRTVDEIREALEKEKTFRGEILNYHKNGTAFWNELSISPVFDQSGQLTNFVGVQQEVTARKIAEESMRQAEARYRDLVESSPAIVYLAKPFPPFAPIYVSPNIARFGYTSEEWLSRPDMWLSLIHEEDRDRVLRTTKVAISQGLDTDLEYRIIARDGSTHWLHDKGRIISDNQGKRVGWQGVILDITETKGLEEQLRQSQKLESVGRLAGGIAHDFNNMLTAINGYSELTLRKLEAEDPLRRNIEEIKKAGERSALLTHQLLAFSRRQVLQPVVLDLIEIITDTIGLLQRLIGEDVELVTALNPKTARVSVDPGQLSQIIMNLAVNARDAMPHGGKLTIETANVFLEPVEARQKVGILPGAYVMLAICDTGSGISDKIRQHIFEPFFTTKEVGRGTGLGLATVYGIVKQSGGNIEVDSQEGVGTTFRIYLPRVADQADATKRKDIQPESPAGTETILLVEDEELVRNLSREILETCGYTVMEAENGAEAFSICEANACQIDLLMTDVVMPQMGGRELAEKLTARLPNLRILFTSGYNDNAVVRHGVTEVNVNFIQKPFTFDALARKVRELLDADGFKSEK